MQVWPAGAALFRTYLRLRFMQKSTILRLHWNAPWSHLLAGGHTCRKSVPNVSESDMIVVRLTYFAKLFRNHRELIQGRHLYCRLEHSTPNKFDRFPDFFPGTNSRPYNADALSISRDGWKLTWSSGAGMPTHTGVPSGATKSSAA